LIYFVEGRKNLVRNTHSFKLLPDVRASYFSFERVLVFFVKIIRRFFYGRFINYMPNDALQAAVNNMIAININSFAFIFLALVFN